MNILCNSKDITKSELSFLRSNHLLAQAIAHYGEENLLTIDKRAYHICVHVNDTDNIPQLMKGLYLKIRSFYNFEDQLHNKDFENRIAFIGAFDVFGSRYNVISNRFEKPHIHAILILPDHLAPKSESDEQFIYMRLRQQIRTLDEVDFFQSENALERNIYIKRLDYDTRSIFEQIDYVTKLDKKNHHDLSDELVRPYVFPYEYGLKRKSYNMEHVRKFELLRTQLYVKREKFFSYERNLNLNEFQQEVWNKIDSCDTKRSREVMLAHLRRTILSSIPMPMPMPMISR